MKTLARKQQCRALTVYGALRGANVASVLNKNRDIKRLWRGIDDVA